LLRFRLEPLGQKFPEVPTNPTRDEALAALKVIRKLIAEFPFDDGRDPSNPMADAVGANEAVMLSAILSAIMRPVLDNVPLHGFNAPVARTGKSLAATLVATVAFPLYAPLARPKRNWKSGLTRCCYGRRRFSCSIISRIRSKAPHCAGC
jgi:hypothetical protein